MEKKQNVPALRFQGFSGEWENFSLKDLSTEIIAGGDIDKALIKDKGDFPVLGNALTNDGIVGYYDDKFRVKAPAVTITGRGDIGHAVARKINFTPVIRLLSVTTPHDVDFLANGINRRKFIAESTGVPQLTVPQVENYKINIPLTKDEEESIGKYFTLLEKSILVGNKKIQKLQQFRQAMLAKLFPREGAAEPELRFHGFSGKWKLRRLSDFVKEVTRVDASSHAPVMMITAANGFINQSERYSFDNSGQSLQKYILLKQGELAYNHGASKLRPFGSCFVLREKEARVPFVYHCFSVTDNYADFVALELNGNLVERQLRRIVSSGARMDGLLNISFEEYCTVEIALPCQEEQRKIGSFFRELDDFISLQQKKLERMQRLKAALLEKLFV